MFFQKIIFIHAIFQININETRVIRHVSHMVIVCIHMASVVACHADPMEKTMSSQCMILFLRICV